MDFYIEKLITAIQVQVTISNGVELETPIDSNMGTVKNLQPDFAVLSNGKEVEYEYFNQSSLEKMVKIFI